MKTEIKQFRVEKEKDKNISKLMKIYGIDNFSLMMNILIDKELFARGLVDDFNCSTLAK